ncbi:hypothetical protein K7X08_035271 [Anisodus acutangulus]|uniref:Wall-associated receptor kinase galacturonan-binding domain-containing protein n=1 Tax=Anisodus acutangulus TaxID=402998 RepID=A0A9Q1LK58_9SOLA|nr:hypothetical protein K7X08_035271 [Anisodus acutangulus]
MFLFVTFITSSIAQSNCVPSSCGDIQEITSPFRLRTDPEHCGTNGYELDCQNNQTVLNYKSRKFYVQEINYKGFSIRLLDPGLKDQEENCTVFPDHKASYDSMTSGIFGWHRANNDINYVNCRAPINSSRDCEARGDAYNCILKDNSDVVTCGHFCKESTPVSQLSFRCKVEYYSVYVLFYGGIGIGALMVLRFLVGIPILIAVIVWQCKRRNLNTSNDDSLGDKASSSEQNC